MAALDLPVEIDVAHGAESPPREGESPEDLVLRLSSVKAVDVAGRRVAAVVLGADTVEGDRERDLE